MAEIQIATGAISAPTAGTSSEYTQLPGQETTVSGIAEATGGIGAGNFIESDIDSRLFKFKSDDTPLMQMMLKAKTISVSSPVVEHYMIDEAKSVLVTTAATSGGSSTASLGIDQTDYNVVRPSGTLLAKGVQGYAPDGATPSGDLMLFVTGHDTNGAPVVRAVNGTKAQPTDEYSNIPSGGIPADTTLVILGNALHETQMEVDPVSIIPQPTEVYLQKRGLNQIVSDYFDAQKKRIPFTQSILAEHAIVTFKQQGNRTLWCGKKGRFRVNVDKMGMQYVYFTEGILGQFTRKFDAPAKWTIEALIALAKMYYTGEDVPNTCTMLAGKDLLESLQCIDFSNHPEVNITVATNKMGWSVTKIHTVFGDIDIKREPCLDRMGMSKSGALLGEDRLVHYQYSAEQQFSEKVEGQQATRKGVLVWDALALKGGCHIFIDGEGTNNAPQAKKFKTWNSATAPTGTDLEAGTYYFLLADCAGISLTASEGDVWLYDGTNWSEYTGEVQLA